MPQHVAVIMDGNGRWAGRRDLPRAAGHRAGARVVRHVVETASEAGVNMLTLFAFSSENWLRPPMEVRLLLRLLRRTIRDELASLNANNVRICFIGNRTRFASALTEEMTAAERYTQWNTGLTLLIAVDYGGRWDIVKRARELARACQDGQIGPDDIDEARFGAGLGLGPFTDPDLCIRTGGECRISNFLLWHLAYSELYFSDVLWPDFGPDQFREGLNWYASRERRFGRIASATSQP